MFIALKNRHSVSALSFAARSFPHLVSPAFAEAVRERDKTTLMIERQLDFLYEMRSYQAIDSLGCFSGVSGFFVVQGSTRFY